MSQLRAIPQAKINFLFFQDIITSVMGILILITLMLSLSLNTGDAASPEEERLQNDLSRAREELTRLESENRTAQQLALSAASLPERSVLENQIEALRREAALAAQARQQAEQLQDATRERDRVALANFQNATSLEQSITNLAQNASALRNEMARAKTNGNIVYLTADLSQAARRPIVFLVASDKIEQRKAGATAEARVLTNDPAPARQLLNGLDPKRDYVVLFFRPSGVKWFAGLRDLVRAAGFEVGYDAIEEQQELSFGSP